MPGGVQRLHLLEDVVARLRIDAGGRLVEEQQRRPVDDGDGEVEPPLHAAGEGAGAVVGPVGQADGGEQLVDPVAGVPAPPRP